MVWTWILLHCSCHKPHWHVVLFVLEVCLSQITIFSGVSWMKGSWYHQFILADHKEQEVKRLDSGLTPPEQVQLAIECLPSSSEKAQNETNPSFSRWTIMDYYKAYSSEAITPRVVFHLYSLSSSIPSCIKFYHFKILHWIYIYARLFGFITSPSCLLLLLVRM